MMALRGVIQYVGSPEATVKELRRSTKENLPNVIDTWHEQMHPINYTPRGARMHRFKQRGRDYEDRKARDYGHRDPNVLTGDMEAMTTRQIRISSTSKGARGALRGPRYLYAYNKDYSQPDKAAEITAVNNQQLQELATRLDQDITHDLNNIRTQETKRF